MAYFPAIKLLGPTGLALPKAEDIASASGDYGLVTLARRADVPAALQDTDGDYAFFLVDASGRLYQAGQIAHDSPISGNPLRIGARARTTEMTAVASDDAVDLIADEYGKQVILPYAIPSKWTDGKTAAITGTADTEVIAAPGASLYLNISWLLVTNTHATVGTLVEWKSSTTVRGRAGAGPAYLGFYVGFKTPLKLAVNQAFNVANITTGSNTYASAGGFISAN